MAILEVGPFRKYRTIAEALFMANAYDILLIDEGTYKEQINISDTPIHLIGNTHHPELGKVLIEPPNETSSRALYFSNLYGTGSVYIEGLNFKFPTISTVPPIYITNCLNTSFIFNRCIINASTEGYYLFDSNYDQAKAIELNYCRLVWKDDVVYPASGARHFELDGRGVEYSIKKCICSNDLSNLDLRYITLPLLYGPNELSIDNTICSGTQPGVGHLTNMFDDDFSVTVTDWLADTLTAGEVISFYTDFGVGNEKSITHFNLSCYSYSVVGGRALYASHNNTDWTLIFNYTQTIYAWSSDFVGIDSYRYYRLDVTYVGAYNMRLRDYYLGCTNLEYTSFDYVLKNNVVGYGPGYGEFQKYTPAEFYIKGTITDSLSSYVKVDDVTFDKYNKTADVVLSNGDLVATLSTSNSYEFQGVSTTCSKKTGKWYFEFKSYDYTYLQETMVGFGLASTSVEDNLGGIDGKSWGYALSTGKIYYNDEVINIGSAVLRGSVLGVALDLSNGKAWFSVNGSWILDGNPETGASPVITFGNIELRPMASLYNRGYGSYASIAELLINPNDLMFPIPQGFEFYSSFVKWKVNYFNTATNEFMGYVYSNADNEYYIETSYSGSHFIICEDASSAPSYNDLLYSDLIPKEVL